MKFCWASDIFVLLLRKEQFINVAKKKKKRRKLRTTHNTRDHKKRTKFLQVVTNSSTQTKETAQRMWGLGVFKNSDTYQEGLFYEKKYWFTLHKSGTAVLPWCSLARLHTFIVSCIQGCQRKTRYWKNTIKLWTWIKNKVKIYKNVGK